ncbi:hypothetical protein K502DRAFT_349297 [Neoconidiobolus thromboides FSU 785]|nr:hypothetical protein K502DRAFT_349297 [Neoconidiobolus thromboides FSU 785]
MRIRSRVGLLKSKLDDIDCTLNKIFQQLDTYSNLELKQKINDYLKWLEKEFTIIYREKRYSNKEIQKKITQLEIILQRNHNLDIFSKISMTKIALRNSNIIGAYQPYGRFLEQGSVFFLNVVDPYNLWFNELTLREILIRKEPNILSYTLMALLARFTLSHKGIAYKEIYGKSLQGVKATLHQCYSNPSYNHVVALGLLCYISLSHYNFNLAKQHLLNAIRMAQCLNYDIDSFSFHMINVNCTRYDELLRGRRVWKILYLFYLVLSSRILNMPVIKFEVKDILQFFRKNQKKYYNSNREISYKAISEVSYLYIKDFIEIYIKISIHMQQIKETYKSVKDFSKIPTNALILPQKEFINCFTIMYNLIQDQNLIKDECEYDRQELIEKINDYEFNSRRYLKLMIHYTSIVLYYPSVMIYPQPVLFERRELKLLFHHANQVIIYCLNISLDNKMSYKDSTKRHKFQANIHIPFYYKLCFCFFMLANLLHHASSLCKEDMWMIDESKVKCILLVNELISVSKSRDKRYVNDATNALNQIRCCIYRFQLPKEFIDEIIVCLNQ